MAEVEAHRPSGEQPWHRRMVARDRDEPHREATPLELLFDLCFVVAVAQAAAQLHHGLVEAQVGPTMLGYVSVFFAIWWAWMNFTWFASAYDTDDVLYRLLTLVQIAGVLVLAAGVPAAFTTYDFSTVTVGYVAMRVALIGQWLRAAREHPAGRQAAVRYAVGVAGCQIGWLARLALPPPWGAVGFALLVLLELAVPVWAERSGQPTSWHPGHIAERYGLFTLIVLGESVLAATTAIQAAIVAGGLSASLLGVAAGGLLLIFGLWWSYFKWSATEEIRLSPRSAFVWGYGHFAVFAAGAALGAGLQVAAEATQHATHLGPAAAALTVAIPVAVYLIVLGLLHAGMDRRQPVGLRFVLVTALLVLLAAGAARFLALSVAVLLMGALVVLLVALHVVAAHRRARTLV